MNKLFLQSLKYLTCITGLLTLSCTQEDENRRIPRIGILQDKPQEWANALRSGFRDGLAELGYHVGKDIILIERSGAGDPLALATQAMSFVKNDKINIIYTLGTQCSEDVHNLSKDKAIIFGAVTDPVRAGFYKDNTTSPIGNITGSQDLWPYLAQFQLIKELIPDIKTIGTIYNASEINSQISIRHIKHHCQVNGIVLKERAITNDQELEIALSSLLSQQIDLFFIPADNTAQTAASTIINMCNNKRVPVFTGIFGIVEEGAIATVGSNYYELGKLNAKQAQQIINNGYNAKIVPIITSTNGDIYLNIRALKANNIKIPAHILDKAVKAYD